MTQHSFFTIGQLAAQFREPVWKVRRAVDALSTDIPRAGLYRLVPAEMLAAIGEKLNRTRTEAAACK